MKLIKPLIFTLVLGISSMINAQTNENPWAIAVGG